MDPQQRAEEHLRVIRSLMERASLYCAISAPTALVGGGLAGLVAVAAWFNLLGNFGTKTVLARAGEWNARAFIVIWLFVLALTLFANTCFIWRKSRREGGPFFTAGLKLAIASAAPIVLITGILTFLFWKNNETAESLPILAVTWIICYGVALLATANFAPRSLVILGWLFLLSGIVAVLGLQWFNHQPTRRACAAMGLTFGLYHLLYAGLTWPTRSRKE